MPAKLEHHSASSPHWRTLDSDQEEDPVEEELASEDEDEEDEILDGEFRMPSRLPSRDLRVCTIRELFDMMDNNTLDLNPSYQRDEVWVKDKQIGLVDSIMRNFYIPPLLLAVKKDEVKGEKRNVVDGKQRLTTLRSFMKGVIPYQDARGRSWFFVSPLGSKKNVIPAEARREIEELQVFVVEYCCLTDRQEHEMFKRVQFGAALKEGEKLAAIASVRADYIGDIIERHVSVPKPKKGTPQGERLAAYVDFETRRSQPYTNICYLAYVLQGMEEHERWHPTRNQVMDWLDQDKDVDESVKRNLEVALQRAREIAADKELSREAGFTMSRRVAPVELIFIGVLMHVMRTATPLRRAQAIKGLRLMLGEEHTGQIRLNSAVSKNSWSYVERTVMGTEDERNVPAEEVKRRPRRKPKVDRLEPTTPVGTPPVTPRKKRALPETTTPGSHVTAKASGSQASGSVSGLQTTSTIRDSSPRNSTHAKLDVSATPRDKRAPPAAITPGPQATAKSSGSRASDTASGSGTAYVVRDSSPWKSGPVEQDSVQSSQRKRLGFPSPKKSKPPSSNAGLPDVSPSRKAEPRRANGSAEPPTKKQKRGGVKDYGVDDELVYPEP
ncbi:hypothetical protein OE88DRAFT_1654853 [Heliocybe sulcata]|uniref:GmrSD restriction endonucleases N-terminal domain-containing protein n=1 Tax=Heliocybe sulcata TaxID=5364 RepID=A0A5C3N8T4_9AGAM|nr:hypothetical protein OE88DRAFT_1654853 [Heliocybe sulcata]